MFQLKKTAILALLALFAFSCSQKRSPKLEGAELVHHMIKKLTDIIVVDIFSPPVASRIYANCALSMYEAVRHQQRDAKSITAKLSGFGRMPVPDPTLSYNYQVAAVQAFCATAKKITFSASEIAEWQDSLILALGAGLDKETMNRSITFGQQVSDVIAARLSSDMYKETRGMDRFEVSTKERSRWIPTAPDYADAMEAHWSSMKLMALAAPDQCPAGKFPAYSETPGSDFYKEMMEVYTRSKNLTDEEKEITMFWDDNPFISRHKGHVMFQDKKMTPGGHWMAIAGIGCRLKKAGLVTSAQAYALTSVGLYDAFIACWHEKYNTVRLRPQTAIQRLVDEQWISFLQTPPFPEYPSGHSTISATAAEILTHMFGDNLSYTDSSELEYNLPVRSFRSFRQAAEEASISRLYGGIHFRCGCEQGNALGKKVAAAILARVR